MKTKAALTLALGLCVTFALSRSASAEKTVELKLASLAPNGTVWEKLLTKAGEDIKKATNGRVTVTFFFGGQQGDEREAIRKIKAGQLDGAAITAVGLGLIKSDVRVLELPFMFDSEKQLDYVRKKMAGDFEAQFDSAGYILVAWGDVGWVHLFTSKDVGELKSKADLQKSNMKMWAWTDDPIVKKFFDRLGMKNKNVVPLGVPDVLPNLNTGKLNACYSSPVAAVALQWFTKMKYATEQPISYSIGAVVISKTKWAEISADDQKIIKKISKDLEKKMKAAVRKENKKARKAMENAGMVFVKTPDAFVAELKTDAKAVWDDLAGKVYDKALLDKVKKYAAEAPK